MVSPFCHSGAILPGVRTIARERLLRIMNASPEG